ncbi:MAG: restriction endonuclease subunit S [Clostridiales bacterium]|jgi:type I restriction enzyme S subunit|nr:restriction endonuclease subunit S [Clostridiales bacterium]MDR2749568.1 restriction endonuclease subunit S [Clostridiales bacterium]
MRYRLGSLIALSEAKNTEGAYGLCNLKGISIKKTFIETKADMTDVSLHKYLIVPPDAFAYVTITSRNGEKITIAHNETNDTYIVSSSYVVFTVTDSAALDSDFLYMYFNRLEFDRYARFNSWGSAREAFSWDNMCDMEIDLPPLSIQKKQACIYKAMLSNQRAYEHGLDDLKLTCDAYVERLRNELPHEAIGEFLVLSEARNSDLECGINSVKGVSIEKRFIETKADMDGVSLKPYLLVKPDAFTYVTVTSRNGEKISLAHNSSEVTYICSSSYVVFEIRDADRLMPSYLHIFFSRPEFDRYTRFNSWGSARETFNWDDMQEVKIPIPDIAIQRSIVSIFNAYIERRELNERLKAQIKDLCPILVKGALEDGNE